MTQTIVYTSSANVLDGADSEAKPDWLGGLVENASSSNLAHSISGVMAYQSGKLFELIEGESNDLKILFERILAAEHHRDVRVLLDIKDSKRIFSNWGMASAADIEASGLLRDFLHTHFDDLVEMSDAQSDELIFFIDHIFNYSPQADAKAMPPTD